MTARDALHALSSSNLDARLVMPTKDGSGQYVEVEAIEANYYVERDGSLWFPDGDFDIASGKMHIFNPKQKPPIGAVKAVVLWEKTAQQRGAPVKPIKPARPTGAKPMRIRALRFNNRSSNMLFRFSFLALLLYVAYPYHKALTDNPMFGIPFGLFCGFILFGGKR